VAEVLLPAEWPDGALGKLLEESSAIIGIGERITFLSCMLLGVPYTEHTLTGGGKEDEALVVNLRGLDCFTFIDYIEAMRHASSPEQFLANVIRTRYRNSEISFKSRNHFFSDWPLSNPACIRDVTRDLGGPRARRGEKRLNLKKDGSLFVPGIAPKDREITYIPSDLVADEFLERLDSGDYAGVYSQEPGLDVSHVGIVVRDGKDIHLRHASSVLRKVVDEDFREYIRSAPGLVVYRPL